MLYWCILFIYVYPDGRRLFIGAPGSWYWQGQFYSIDANAEFGFTPGGRYTYRIFGEGQTYSVDANAQFPYTPAGRYSDRVYGEGQVFQQPLETRPAVVATQEGPAWDDDSYMGYSVAVGDFYGEGVQGAAVGMPRGAGLEGKVLLFTWNLTNYQNLTGRVSKSRQIGTYFGYSVASSDVDGDGRDDLIVGAPLHTEPNSENKYEVGRVYVFYQGSTKWERFHQHHVLDGSNSKSRFGLAVASLGDINLDTFGDFAVGAPYDGPNERGAIYIYHGSRTGVREKYSQVIYAEAVGRQISTFGFSVSGGLDLDGNDYPDMIVGAYLSDAAFFFRSRPVAVIKSNLQFLSDTKEIILEDRRCQHSGELVPCVWFEYCATYEGEGVPQVINLNVEYLLDSKKLHQKRMFFTDSNLATRRQEIYLHKGSKPVCRKMEVYITNQIRDKLTPLEVEVKYSLNESDSYVAARRDPQAPLTPVLDLDQPPVKDSISVHKNCGHDNVCIPDLALNCTPNVDRFLLSRENVLVLDVVVANHGEDAFESNFYIKIPPMVFYKQVTEEKTEVKISCSEKQEDIIHCEIGNPLPGGKIANFKIHFTANESVVPDDGFYTFEMKVNSTNNESVGDDLNNVLKSRIQVWVDYELKLEGNSHPAEVHYDPSEYPSKNISDLEFEYEIGPQVIHLYSVTNIRPATVDKAEITFIWPYKTLGEEDLLMLLEPPEAKYTDTKYGTPVINCDNDAVFAAITHGRMKLDPFRTSLWEAVGLSEIRKTKFEADEDISGIEERRPAATVSGSNFFGGTSKDETSMPAIHAGDSSFDTSRRHEMSSSSSSSGSYESRRQGGQTVSTGSSEAGRGGGQTASRDNFDARGRSGNVVSTGSFESNRGSGHTSSSGDYESSWGNGQASVGSFDASGRSGHYNGSVTIAAERGGGYAVVPEGDRGVNTATIQRISKYNTTFRDGVPVGRTYENTTIVRDSQGRIIDQQTQHAQARDFAAGSRQAVSTGSASGSNQPYPVHIPTTTHHFDWDAPAGRQEQHHENRVEGSVQRGQQSYGEVHTNQYYDRNGQVVGGGYQNKQDREFHSRGQDVRGYGGNDKRYDDEQLSAAIGSQHQQSAIENAAAGHGFRTNVINMDGGAAVEITEGVSNHLVDDQQRHRQQQQQQPRTYFDPDLGVYREYRNPRTRDTDPRHPARDNVPTDRPDPNQIYTGRRRRRDLTDIELQSLENCKATLCMPISCSVGPLKENQTVYIGLRARVNVRTLRNITESRAITVSSMMTARIADRPNRELKRYEIFTNVTAPQTEVKPGVVPLWVIVLSAVAGALILLLLIFLLYKCGFFKRDRPSSTRAERQPLNKNGYHHGDEAL